MIKKLPTLAVALFALLAFGVIAASSAFAEGEWLVEGKEITQAEGSLRAEIEGEILFVRWETEALTKVLNEFLCSGIFIGTIGPRGKDTITEIQTLSSTSVSATPLVGTPFTCDTTFDGGALTDCSNEPGNLLLWADNLPWSSELELMANGTLLDRITGTGGEPGYDVECDKSLLGVSGGELCERLPGTMSLALSNDLTTSPVSVTGEFKPESDEELGVCAGGTEHVTELVSEGPGHVWASPSGLASRLATSVVE